VLYVLKGFSPAPDNTAQREIIDAKHRGSGGGPRVGQGANQS